MTHYIVQSAAAKMPSKVRAPYRRVAVLEVDDGRAHVAMISDRARGVIRIVQTWERLNVGKCVRSAYVVAMREAKALAEELNDKS